MAVTWRLQLGDQRLVRGGDLPWRLHGGYMAVTWRLQLGDQRLVRGGDLPKHGQLRAAVGRLPRAAGEGLCGETVVESDHPLGVEARGSQRSAAAEYEAHLPWRLHGGYMAVTWRLHGGYNSAISASSVVVTCHGAYMAVTWRLHGGYSSAISASSVVVTCRSTGSFEPLSAASRALQGKASAERQSSRATIRSE